MPQDEHDRQPLLIGDGRYLLVADSRIDNREELIEGLSLPASALATLSDADFLAKAFERWQDRMVEHVIGDFAFAVFDRVNEELILARDPLGQRPLHFIRRRGLVTFASMPRAFAALPEIDLQVDVEQIAKFVADMNLIGSGTYYRGVERVEPGQMVRLSAERTIKRHYWNPPIGGLRLPADADYVAAFREQLDRATASRLRGARGVVAAHLSAGFDSSAVTATAARLLAPSSGKVIAFTSAPRVDFDGPVPRGRVADESPYAALTASHYGNIEHVVLRDRGHSAFALLDRNNRLFQYPIQQVDNDLWWSRINEAAQSRGASVLLTGQYGNLTLNAAGLGLLADLVRTGSWRRWWKEARLSVRNSSARWTGVLANSFGPWLTPRSWDYVRSIFLGSSTRANTPFLLNAAWAKRVDSRIRLGFDGRPRRNSYLFRRDLLKSLDIGCFRKGALAGYGIDERDPTADRRLVEFSLSLPHDQLLRNGVTRPLARSALADRVPHAILNDAPRGLQGAGWYEIMRRDEAAQCVERMREEPILRSVLNLERLQELVDRWPTGDWNDDWVAQEYRQGLAKAISVASFVRSVSHDPV